MLELHLHLRSRRSDSLSLCPQEIRGLISRHLIVLGRRCLILCHLERIAVNRTWGRVRIITVEIDLGVIILIEDVILRHPHLILGVSKFHVISLVIFQKESAWRFAIVIHQIDTYCIVCTEAIVINTGGILLVDIARNLHLW